MMNGFDIWCLRYECNISGIEENRNPPCASSPTVTQTQRYNNRAAIPTQQPLFPTVSTDHHQRDIQAG